jgi:hypothetical protein
MTRFVARSWPSPLAQTRFEPPNFLGNMRRAWL